jgi:Ca2+-binding RTX toxin-like protein
LFSLADLVADRDGTDTAEGVEFFQFADQTVAAGALLGVTVTGTAGNDVISATKAPAGQPYPTAYGDVILGLGGNDTLNGAGGDDWMEGGAGNDTYIAESTGDQAIELAGGGTDTVKASVSFTLGAYVEKLMLTGTDAIDGTGNDRANTLKGNGAANVLRGLEGKDSLNGGLGDDRLVGGAGADGLTGGGGADAFVFDTLGTAADKDTVKDFAAGEDWIEIELSAFGAFAGEAAGPLPASAFALGTAATTSDQHLIYNSANGALYYDPDGAGGAGQVQIAIFTTLPALSANDFMLV